MTSVYSLLCPISLLPFLYDVFIFRSSTTPLRQTSRRRREQVKFSSRSSRRLWRSTASRSPTLRVGQRTVALTSRSCESTSSWRTTGSGGTGVTATSPTRPPRTRSAPRPTLRNRRTRARVTSSSLLSRPWRR